LRGAYYGAEDVGCNVYDVQNMGKYTRFVSCLPQDIGGSGNPSFPTAQGVVRAMESALAYLKMGDLNGKTVAVQGAGNVASFIIDLLLKRNVKKIYVTDIHESKIEEAKQKFAGKPVELETVSPFDTSIFSKEVDIFSPCALGGILNKDTIPLIKAKIICGAANNQLLFTADGERLRNRKITYVPDFVANRMGIVNCANEQYGYVNDDPYFFNHLGNEWEQSVYNVVTQMLELSNNKSISPDVAACEMADALALRPHPIWGHRSKFIINSLIDSNWETS